MTDYKQSHLRSSHAIFLSISMYETGKYVYTTYLKADMYSDCVAKGGSVTSFQVISKKLEVEDKIITSDLTSWFSVPTL